MKTSSAVTAGHRGLEDSRIYKLALTGLFAALSYVCLLYTSLLIEEANRQGGIDNIAVVLVSPSGREAGVC